jgi:hypothetical protein
MCTSRHIYRLILATALTGCSGGLTLPDDRSSSQATLLVVSGDRQQGTVLRRLEDPLVVKLTDASAQPIAGVPVVFQFKSPVPGAEVDPEATTDSDGLASAEVRLGINTGPYQIEARATSPAALTTFVVTAVERNGGGGGGPGGGGGNDDD